MLIRTSRSHPSTVVAASLLAAFLLLTCFLLSGCIISSQGASEAGITWGTTGHIGTYVKNDGDKNDATSRHELDVDPFVGAVTALRGTPPSPDPSPSPAPAGPLDPDGGVTP